MNSTCPLYDLMLATVNLQGVQLDSEQVMASTTNLLSESLEDLYNEVNASLQSIVSQIEKDTKSDDINKDQVLYSQVSQMGQNLENVINSNVQTTETQAQQLSTDQQLTMQFASTVTNLMSYLSSLLQGKLG